MLIELSQDVLLISAAILLGRSLFMRDLADKISTTMGELYGPYTALLRISTLKTTAIGGFLLWKLLTYG